MGITFPRFIFPFLSRRFKHNIKASSELALSFNYQERPEFTRIIAGAGWKYKWNNRRGTRRSTWDFVDISYVHIPNSIDDFIDQLNPRIRYSYEDHFIMRTGFTYQWTNRRIPSANAGILTRNRIQPRVYNVRAAIETAGNLLYAYSSIFKQKKSDGVYKIFGTQYAQYAKAEFDYTVLRNFNTRHGLAFHAGLGVAFPYGNSRVIPFEKRFYAGGANGVRGWAVRTLGPGGFPGGDGDNTADFLNQCGDINLLLSLEYRAKLFWLLEGALFVDAGNIWTIRSYENQPYGVFKFDKFWQQMAMAYGAGLRMDFTYFIFRIDLGLKLHNPAEGQLKWPITKMSWKRDATFLFAVGYPF
ncbi:MAG: outer membrane protein assembly factor [Candidatus Amulumruptor sp.]